MNDRGVQFEVNLDSIDEARAIAADVRAQGATAEVTEEHGLLPLPVLLAIVIPPGVALLVQVIDRVIRNHTRNGILIDARGDDPPRITSERDLPYGTAVILTRNGDEAQRSDLPADKVSEYVAEVLKALSSGASADQAEATGAAAVAL